MHSHHSHSGEFCQHASGSLESSIEAAKQQKLTVFCLTEHMPRLHPDHLYPEELASNTTIESLKATFDRYMVKAKQLQASTPSPKILVGFEAEGIDHDTLNYVNQLKQQYKPDLVVGSLHHAHGVPIDFDRGRWQAAADKAGGVEELFGAYFDEQYAMIEAIKPTVVGHFDLIRLFAPTLDLSCVWPKVLRNIKLAVSLGCLFELNTAAIRKGWTTPYPQADVCDAIKANGGRFCLSCDSHCAAQVGQHFGEIGQYVAKYGPLYAADGSVVSASDYESWVNAR